MRDQDGGEGHVVVAGPGVVVQEQERLDDVVQAKAHFWGNDSCTLSMNANTGK